MKIKMTSVLVSDPNEALKFYTEILGFQTLMHMPEMRLAIVVDPKNPDGTALMLEPNETPFAKTFQETAYEKGLPVIVFGSDDVVAEYERLKSKGVVFKSEPKKTEWGTLAVFDDTFGNYIQIHQDA